MGADQLMFRIAYDCEDVLGVAHDENHAVFRWSEHRIFFSCAEKGCSLSAHFSSDTEGLRHIKQAIEEFCQWAFDVMPWCKMIFACIERKSVERLVRKCQFTYLDTRKGLQIYVRYRPWVLSSAAVAEARVQSILLHSK